ncbi:MAG: hypothetical protein AB7J13_04335, partial [Pyrinomonadaceae bacterium]
MPPRWGSGVRSLPFQVLTFGVLTLEDEQRDGAGGVAGEFAGPGGFDAGPFVGGKAAAFSVRESGGGVAGNEGGCYVCGRQVGDAKPVEFGPVAL